MAETWKVFSDTDRFNRAAGLGFEFDEVPLADGGVERVGLLRKFGLNIRWVETAFDFESPHWFENERNFLDGPALRLITTLLVEPHADGGCRVSYTVQITPRNWATMPVVYADARLTTGPLLEKTLNAAKGLAEGKRVRFDPPPPGLSEQTLALLQTRADQTVPLAIGEALAQRIATAPDHDLSRIRPLRLAAELGVSDHDAIRGCLSAVGHGLLEMSWELLCPSCNGPKSAKAALDLEPAEVHCPSCNIRYDGNFPDSVDVVFKPASDVRPVDDQVDCVLSPQRTPHVLARQRLQSGQVASWQLDLDAGGYVLDTSPSKGGASLRVVEGCGLREVTVDWNVRGARPQVLEVEPGPVVLHLRNRRRDVAEASLKRRFRPPWCLTAGELLSIDGVADLLPPSAVAPGVDWKVMRGIVLAVEQRAGDADKLTPLLAGWTGVRLSYSGDRSLITVWSDAAAAIAAAESLAGDRDLAVGCAVGALTRVRQGATAFPMGATVDQALKVMRGIGAGRVGIDTAALEDDEIDAALDALGRGVRIRSSGQVPWQELRFAAAVQRRRQAVAQARARAPKVPALLGGRYRLGNKLAEGGMGVVFAVTDEAQGAPTVVKLLKPEFATDSRYVQRFYNEARLSCELDHPNIVSVHDYGQDGEQLWIAMERLDGEELHDQLERQGHIEVKELRDIAAGVLSALDAAHTKGIVHRDLKPENIFLAVDARGELVVKVIDFGIAQQMSEDDELAEQGILVGTLGYVSPEQARLEALDGRSDLYSLGVMLYQCVSGQLPFHADDPMTLVMMRMDTTPAPVQQVAPQVVPRELAGVIERAMRVDPDERFAGAAEMERALRV